jgi:hypothetical protein
MEPEPLEPHDNFYMEPEPSEPHNNFYMEPEPLEPHDNFYMEPEPKWDKNAAMCIWMQQKKLI